MTRRATVIAAVVVVLSMEAGPALAHYIKQIVVTNEFGGDKCLQQTSEISDGHHGSSGNPLGYSEADTRAFMKTPVPLPGLGCQASVMIAWLRPNGYIRAKVELLKHYTLSNGDSGFGVCRDTSYKHNSGTAAAVSMGVYWNRPCGHGWYSTRAFAGIKYDGNWKTGRLWPGGSHYL